MLRPVRDWGDFRVAEPELDTTMGLTKRQQLFVTSYCENPELGQTEAARAAGCGKRAKITACEWMRKPEIITEVQRRLNRRIERIERQATNLVTTESVLQDMADLEEAIKQAGMGAWQAATLLKILELRGKFLKMFTDKLELNFDDALIEKLLEGRKRAGLPKQLPSAEGEFVQ